MNRPWLTHMQDSTLEIILSVFPFPSSEDLDFTPFTCWHVPWAMSKLRRTWWESWHLKIERLNFFKMHTLCGHCVFILSLMRFFSSLHNLESLSAWRQNVIVEILYCWWNSVLVESRGDKITLLNVVNLKLPQIQRFYITNFCLTCTCKTKMYIFGKKHWRAVDI